MEKWTFENFSVFFSKTRRPHMNRPFYPVECYHSPWIIRIHQESSSRGKETFHILLAIFSIFAKMTIIQPPGNTDFLAKSNFNNSANICPLTTNHGALELYDQGELVLDLLAGDRHIYKNNHLVQGK